MRAEGTAETSPDTRVRIILPANTLTVRRTLRSIRAGLEPLGIARDEIASVEIVLAELLNNIVEHAYAGIAGGMIDLRLLRNADGLCCTILDTGRSMPGDEPPPGRQAEPGCATPDLAEGGFGWFLIRALTCDLEYVRHGHCNRTSFRMPVSPRP
ncbi:ATP-binding protein [Celeribacter indicus]|uniref:Anti-sigma B factor n=1 Tax=Celeribacter indicus TaxID=1208324 RepID=A0A0B5DNH4_9RHOB|nr:ATP-binding protein [Celeribacter indicus]AJE45138.1 anti-sigma B factor [Celeribacter indicus]SDX26591.1 serine/threonine-protein kinase RsbW [Celeribacter indicus]